MPGPGAGLDSRRLAAELGLKVFEHRVKVPDRLVAPCVFPEYENEWAVSRPSRRS